MSNMYGKDKFHDRQKAVLQKSAQKIENDSGWSQDNFLRGYAEEILPASGAELSFGELCAIGEQVEQEAAFSAKEAMRNKIKARRDAERYKSTGTDSEQRTPNPFEDSSAIATESPKNEDTLNTMRKHADAQPTKSAGIKTSKKQSLVETTRELKKYIHIISCGGVLYYHNEYYYTQLDSKQLIKLYRQNVDYELNNESSLRGYKDLYDCLVTDPQIECSEPEDEPIYAPLENGILDLMEWKLYPHSPDQITFTCIKAKYDPQAKCQIFEEYLQRVTGGDSLLSERVWMAIGYLLIYPARGKFFIFMKGIGNSGKSVLGSFIRRLYPKESISSIRLKQMKNEFGMSSLANAVINFDMDEAYEILSDKDKRWQYNQSFYQNEESSHYSESEPQRNSWTESSYRAQAETASQGSKTTSGKGCARTGCGCLTVFIVIFMFMGVVGSFSLTKENKSASASEVSTAASMNDQSESRTEETMPISNETKASSEIQNGPIYNSVDPPDSTDSRQEILVEATGSNAMLTLWTYRDGQWVEDMSTTAAIGSDGLTTNKTEGDHMTPEGTFPIYFAFSTKAKNTKIAFETISEDSVWVCDPESVYYNTLQSKNNPDKDWTDKGGAENMYPKFSKGSSNACICFGFNGDGWSPYGAVAYGGSALFIDGVGENGKMNSGYGDIKISGKDMTKLLSYLDSDYNPTITIRAAQ